MQLSSNGGEDERAISLAIFPDYIVAILTIVRSRSCLPGSSHCRFLVDRWQARVILCRNIVEALFGGCCRLEFRRCLCDPSSWGQLIRGAILVHYAPMTTGLQQKLCLIRNDCQKLAYCPRSLFSQSCLCFL